VAGRRRMAGRAERSRTGLQCDAGFPRPRWQKPVERLATPACGQASCSTRKPASGKLGSGTRSGQPGRRLAAIARSKVRPGEPSHRGSQRASETRPAQASPSGSQAIPKGCQSSNGNARAWVRRLERRCRGSRLLHNAYNARRGALPETSPNPSNLCDEIPIILLNRSATAGCCRMVNGHSTVMPERRMMADLCLTQSACTARARRSAPRDPKSGQSRETRYKLFRRLSIFDHQLRRQVIHTQRISHEIPRLGLLHPR
jgi:hypothetical protein